METAFFRKESRDPGDPSLTMQILTGGQGPPPFIRCRAPLYRRTAAISGLLGRTHHFYTIIGPLNALKRTPRASRPRQSTFAPFLSQTKNRVSFIFFLFFFSIFFANFFWFSTTNGKKVGTAAGPFRADTPALACRAWVGRVMWVFGRLRSPGACWGLARGHKRSERV